MEIVNDLMGVQTVLPIGKTAKLYNVSGDIADDVSISIDGQAPYSSITLNLVRMATPSRFSLRVMALTGVTLQALAR